MSLLIKLGDESSVPFPTSARFGMFVDANGGVPWSPQLSDVIPTAGKSVTLSTSTIAYQGDSDVDMRLPIDHKTSNFVSSYTEQHLLIKQYITHYNSRPLEEGNKLNTLPIFELEYKIRLL